MIYTVNEFGRCASEMVLSGLNILRSRNSGKGIHKLINITLSPDDQQRKWPIVLTTKPRLDVR